MVKGERGFKYYLCESEMEKEIYLLYLHLAENRK